MSYLNVHFYPNFYGTVTYYRHLCCWFICSSTRNVDSDKVDSKITMTHLLLLLIKINFLRSYFLSKCVCFSTIGKSCKTLSCFHAQQAHDCLLKQCRLLHSIRLWFSVIRWCKIAVSLVSAQSCDSWTVGTMHWKMFYLHVWSCCLYWLWEDLFWLIRFHGGRLGTKYWVMFTKRLKNEVLAFRSQVLLFFLLLRSL